MFNLLAIILDSFRGTIESISQYKEENMINEKNERDIRQRVLILDKYGKRTFRKLKKKMNENEAIKFCKEYHK